jgi:hypothetical protein
LPELHPQPGDFVDGDGEVVAWNDLPKPCPTVDGIDMGVESLFFFARLYATSVPPARNIVNIIPAIQLVTCIYEYSKKG